MTRDDLFDWVRLKGCLVDPKEGINVRGNSIKVFNPATGTHAFIDTPIDDTYVPLPVVYIVCSKLGIEIPDCAKDVKPFWEQLNKKLKRGE